MTFQGRWNWGKEEKKRRWNSPFFPLLWTKEWGGGGGDVKVGWEDVKLWAKLQKLLQVAPCKVYADILKFILNSFIILRTRWDIRGHSSAWLDGCASHDQYSLPYLPFFLALCAHVELPDRWCSSRCGLWPWAIPRIALVNTKLEFDILFLVVHATKKTFFFCCAHTHVPHIWISPVLTPD